MKNKRYKWKSYTTNVCILTCDIVGNTNKSDETIPHKDKKKSTDNEVDQLGMYSGTRPLLQRSVAINVITNG